MVNPRCTVANVLVNDIVASEFEIQSILSVKFAQAINMFLLINCGLIYIVWHEEILNHNTFLLLHVFELCSLFTNNCGSDFCYSDTTNIRRPTFKSSIPKLTRPDLTIYL